MFSSIFVTALFTIIAGILGFIKTYPKPGLKLSEYLFLAVWVVWMFAFVYNLATQDAYSKSKNVSNIQLFKPQSRPLEFINTSDTNLLRENLRRGEENLRLQKIDNKIYSQERETVDSIGRAISAVKGSEDKSYMELNDHFILIIIGLIVCIVFGFWLTQHEATKANTQA